MSTVLAPEDVCFLQVIISREIGGSHVDLPVPVDEADPSGASISLECHRISRLCSTLVNASIGKPVNV